MVSKFERNNKDPHRVRNVFHVDFGSGKKPDLEKFKTPLDERLLKGGEKARQALKTFEKNPSALTTIVNSDQIEPELQKLALRLLVRLLKDDGFPKQNFDQQSLITIMACAEYVGDQKNAAKAFLELYPELNTVTGSAHAVCICYELANNPKIKELLFERLEEFVRLADEDQLRKLGMDTMVLPHVIARTADEELAFKLFECVFIPSHFCTIMDLCADNTKRGFKILDKMKKDAMNLSAVAIENKNPLLRGKAVLMLLGNNESLEGVAEMGMFEDTAQVAISLLPEEMRAEVQRKRTESQAECQGLAELTDKDKEDLDVFLASLAESHVANLPQHTRNIVAPYDTEETDPEKLRKHLKSIWDNRSILDSLSCMTQNLVLRRLVMDRISALDFGNDLAKR
jgi:hypothetical protein